MSTLKFRPGVLYLKGVELKLSFPATSLGEIFSLKDTGSTACADNRGGTGNPPPPPDLKITVFMIVFLERCQRTPCKEDPCNFQSRRPTSIYQYCAKRSPPHTPGRLFGVHVFPPSFPWKQAFWYTPIPFFACWGTWVFRAENAFGVYFFPSDNGSLSWRELTKSWSAIEQLCALSLALSILCCLSATKSVYKLGFARSWQNVGHELPTFDIKSSVLKLHGSILQSSSGNTSLLWPPRLHHFAVTSPPVWKRSRNEGNTKINTVNCNPPPWSSSPKSPQSLTSVLHSKTCLEKSTKWQEWDQLFRKLEKAVAVSGICSGVPEESCGKIPGGFWAPANPTRNPNPTWNNVICSVHAVAENAEKLVVFCHFQSNAFQCTKHHRHKPDTKQHEKHHKIRSKPTMKPQTQRETTASRSFITLGSTNSPTMSPDTKHTRHETTSSLGRFSAATTVESASQGCPCHVQQQCCFIWGLVS